MKEVIVSILSFFAIKKLCLSRQESCIKPGYVKSSKFRSKKGPFITLGKEDIHVAADGIQSSIFSRIFPDILILENELYN